MTTSSGRPISDKNNILTAGARGPMLMEDVIYYDEIAHFDRERIPERVVHAKGAGNLLTFTYITRDVVSSMVCNYLVLKLPKLAVKSADEARSTLVLFKCITTVIWAVDHQLIQIIVTGAHGYFEVTNDITKYCKANIFCEVGKKTPLFIRFSTVGLSNALSSLTDCIIVITIYYNQRKNNTAYKFLL